MDQIIFDDPFVPVPSEALEADPAQALRTLLARVAALEAAQESLRSQATEQLRTVLLSLLDLYDEVTTLIERHGVATNAQDAVLVRALIGLGRQIMAVLRAQRVEPISTIGKVADPDTSDTVGSEPHANVRPGVVLREARLGYGWPHGVLRRAQVVVSELPGGSTTPADVAER